MLISGDVLPVGKINANGWGVPDSKAEIDSIVNSLVGKSITVCPRDQPHGCDYDPKSEIGTIKHVWHDPLRSTIRSIGEVLDPTAIEKIKTGIWKKNWSIRVSASNVDKDGWVRSPVSQNLTMVPKGAWAEANWDILASNESGVSFRTLDDFEIVANDNEGVRTQQSDEQSFSEDVNDHISVSFSSSLKSSGSIPNVNITWSEPEKQVANTMEQSDEKTAGATPKKEVETMVKTEENKPTTDNKDDVVAAKDAEITALKDQVASMTATFENKAKEYAAQAVAAAKAEAAREAAIKDYVATAEKHGVKEIDTKVFEGLNADQIAGFTAALAKIEVKAGAEDDKTAGIKYPAGRNSTDEELGNLSVGIPVIDENGNKVFKTKM